MGFGNTLFQSGVGAPAGKGGRSSGIGMPQQSINPMQITSGNNTQPLIPESELYFRRNPDVAEAFQNNNYGMSQDEFAKTHFDKYGRAEGRIPMQPQANIGFGGQANFSDGTFNPAFASTSGRGAQPQFGSPNMNLNRGPWDNAQFNSPRMGGGKGKGM